MKPADRAQLLAPQTLIRLERLVELARRVSATPQGKRRKQPGRGIELGASRAYFPGDDVRLVDWAAYARLDRLLVRIQESLPDPRLELIVDGSASMLHGHPTPCLRACLAGAALAAAAVARQVRVVVWWASSAPARLELSRPGKLISLLHFFSSQLAEGSGGLAAAVAQVTGTSKLRGGAIVLSDGLEAGLLPAALRLKAGGFDTLMALVLPDAELSPQLEEAIRERALAEFADAETGERRRLGCSLPGLEVAYKLRLDRSDRICKELAGLGVRSEVLPPASPFESLAHALLRE